MLNKLQFQNLAELQLQNLDQPLCSKSEKSLVLGPNVSSQICNKLLPTWSLASTSATVTTSTSLELASSQARVTSIKSTKRYGVSELVSESVTDKHCQWSDSGPIKRQRQDLLQGWEGEGKSSLCAGSSRSGPHLRCIQACTTFKLPPRRLLVTD